MNRIVRTVFGALFAFAVTVIATPAWCAVGSPIAEGKSLFENKCGSCHTLERSLSLHTDRDGWEATIARMVRRGTKFEKGQASQIVGYLGARNTFETRCNICHDLQQPLAAIKQPDQWYATVMRMAAMKPGLLTDAESGAIALYLSLVAPVTPAASAAQ